VVEADCNTNNSYKELADKHAQSTPEKYRTTTPFLNCIEGDRCRADVDQSEDEGDQESVTNCASRLQEGSGVVEDEVDTRPAEQMLMNC
jgi:hypothetical protein